MPPSCVENVNGAGMIGTGVRVRSKLFLFGRIAPQNGKGGNIYDVSCHLQKFTSVTCAFEQYRYDTRPLTNLNSLDQDQTEVDVNHEVGMGAADVQSPLLVCALHSDCCDGLINYRDSYFRADVVRYQRCSCDPPIVSTVI